MVAEPDKSMDPAFMETPPGICQTHFMRHRLRGQAMVEYSILNWVLVVGLVLTSTVRMIPGPQHSTMSLVELLFDAFQLHYDTYMYSLSLAFP
jgi:hypothetical protein